MTNTSSVPYGEWASPITPDLVISEGIRLSAPAIDGADIYWTELRPADGGRITLVRRTPDSQIADVTPAPFNVRTRVHEYGGGAYLVVDGTVYFSNFDDQRLYRQQLGGTPQPISRQPDMRYADATIDRERGRLILVREDHSQAGREAVNTLVTMDLDGGNEHVIVSGNDFYAGPRLSPDGTRLTWQTWNHPNMPWDTTEIWVAPIAADGSLERAERVAGGKNESVLQPRWSPDGMLYFLSDRTGWWNLYRWHEGTEEAICPMDAEFGLPQWVFGISTYSFVDPATIICSYQQHGRGYLARLETTSGALSPIDTPYTQFSGLHATPGSALFEAGSPTESGAIVLLNLADGAIDVLRRRGTIALDPAFISVAQPIEFPTEHGLTAHAFYYAPRNPNSVAPAGELPPLLVKSHGGPTGGATDVLDLTKQYWTSRGFAIVDVNYGGSVGYGRAYRERLYGEWGVVDVDDCVNAARYLIEQGLADPRRLVIDGGSAGGYTTLCALTFRDTFKAGASYYGIGDLEIFVHDTHKFESRYMDQLVGPYPEQMQRYKERSPINYIDRFSCPVILLQGLEDKIVPPNQAELMYEAVRAKGLPVAYLPFAGEQHGFRRAENIKRALEAEFYFYARVFGYTPADTIEPLEIANL